MWYGIFLNKVTGPFYLVVPVTGNTFMCEERISAVERRQCWNFSERWSTALLQQH
jgi:hypothetical protein